MPKEWTMFSSDISLFKTEFFLYFKGKKALMNQFSNQTIENQKIILPNVEMNYLGHNLILKNCEVVIDTSAKGLVVADVQFINSRIVVKKTLNNFRWHSADLIDCSIQGKFVGNDFGSRDFGIASRGVVQNCDFSLAILDGCRFFDCDVDSLIVPPWPCFALKKPLDKIEWLREFEGGELAELAEIYEDDGLNPDMIVESAISVAKETGIDIEILREAFDASRKD